MKYFFILIFLVPQISKSQAVCTKESRQKLESTLHSISKINVEGKSMNELVLEIGTSFLGIPYVEKTLEVEGDEKIVINLMGLDCTTYLETIITLSRLARMELYSFEDYESELEVLRYRDGKLDGYSSRLHYFSDWIYNNQQKEILKDITKEIGGKHYANNPSFMSENPKFYPQLTNEAFINEMKAYEKNISKRTYYYLPKESVANHEEKIQSGDLIAITISMDNLDISHVGFAVEQNGRIHLMHASSSLKKVVISEKPLSDYLSSHKTQSGIMVCRLIEPE